MLVSALCLVATLAIILNISSALNEELVSKLEVAATATKGSIGTIFNEWQVDKYPLFLKSCYMHKLSWELLKLKFQKKILSALAPQNGEKTKFVISFTGR